MLDIPLHLQGVKTAYCVPYSLVGVAQYYGIKVTKPQMIEAVRCDKESGTCTSNLNEKIKYFGIRCKDFKFCFRNVKKSLNQGIPVIVSYLTDRDTSHVSVIIDTRKDNRGTEYYTLNDTYYGRYEIPASILSYLMYKDSIHNLPRKSWSRQVVKV